jgi:hypothetical protein
MFMERMGNLERPEGKKQLERQSPLNSAAKIKTPLMVMQGANDPRVNRAESEQIVAALNDRGFPVEYLLAPDEGHGFARPVNNMAGFAAAEKFLAQHLGGRYQDNMPRDVAERLRVLTVDPKTVKRTNTITMAPPPKPIGSLRAGTTSYRATLQMNGSTINLSSTSDVKEQDDSWLVTETMRTPIGDVTDTAVLDKTSLVLRKRTLLQGPATMEYEVKNGKAAGEMTLMGAQSHPIATDVYGDLYADGPGAALAIALLPLADGYTTSFRNFDPQTQKVRTMQLVVGGTESITVPAGTFDAFKVDITSSAGPTVTEWVAKDSKTVLKVVATLPNLNGAVLTKELKATDGRD